MLILITGQPGNGKSLRALWMASQEYDRNAGEVKAGKEQPRRFFTNIAGATTDENPKAFPWMERMPEHNDWTLLPDGSYVVYDEAHADGNTRELERYGRLFPSTGKPGESDDARIRSMSTHRHRGFDIVLVTQWPSKIHHQIRTLIGEHVHMTRAMGLGCAGTMKWTRVQVDPYDEKQREKAEEEIWRFDKSLYERYKSSSLHTSSHKFRLSPKIMSGISTLVMTLLVMWGLYYFVVGRKTSDEPEQGGDAPAAAAPASLFGSQSDQKDDEPVLTPGMGEHAALNTMPVPTLAGCVSSDRGCRCFNSEGFQIDMARHECEATMSKPLPFNVYHEFRAGNAPPTTHEGPAVETPSSTTVSKGANSAETFPESPGYQCETCES